MTNYKETSLNELEYVTGGAAQEYAALARYILPKQLAGGSIGIIDDIKILENSSIASQLTDTLASKFGIIAKFQHPFAEEASNIYMDKLTGQSLAYADVIKRLAIK